MNLTIINDTSFMRLTVSLGGNEYHLRPGENTFTDIPQSFEMGIKIHDKNHFNSMWVILLLYVLFFEWITEKGTLVHLNCNSLYKLHTDKEDCVIKLTEVRASHKTGVSYNSVFLDTDDAVIEYASQSVKDKEETKKKYKNKNLLCTFMYLLVVVGLSLILTSEEWIFLVLLLGVFLLCIMSPVGNIIKCSKSFSDEEANIALNKEIQKKMGEK